MAMDARAESSLGVAEAANTIGSRRLQSETGSIHVDVMHPKRIMGWRSFVTRHFKALLKSNTSHIIKVQVGDDERECPGPTVAVRAMSEQANLVWGSCKMPMAIAPVEIQVSTDILGAAQQVLDILSDDEAFGEESFIFLSVPRLTLAHEHGPSYAEYKKQTKGQLDALVVFIVIMSILVLLVVIWLLHTRFSTAEGSARSPWRRAVMPATFMASLLTGTVAAPVAVGVYWRFRKNNSEESAENLATNETELVETELDERELDENHFDRGDVAAD